jgi:hypothetical protein
MVFTLSKRIFSQLFKICPTFVVIEFYFES